MRFFLMKIVLERKHQLLKTGMFHKNTVVWTKLLLQSFSSSRRNFWVGLKKAVIWNDHMKYGKTRVYLCSKAGPASSSSQVSICWARGYATFIGLSFISTWNKTKYWRLSIFNQIQYFFPTSLSCSLNVELSSTGPLSWGGLNSYPDNFCQGVQWEKGLCVTLRIYSIYRNNTWQVWLV